MKMMSDRQVDRKIQDRPIMNSFDAYRHMQNAEHCELVEGKVLKFTKVKDKTLEKHLKVVTKKGCKTRKDFRWVCSIRYRHEMLHQLSITYLTSQLRRTC